MQQNKEEIMKNYTTPACELLIFAAEDLLVLSDENQTAPDYLENTLVVQDIQNI